MIFVHSISDHCSELVEQQPENGLALAYGPAETLGVVVKDGAGGAAIEAALITAEWPGFRGADRMGRAKTPKLATDWKANSPKLLWKKPVGAGWSSFAVAGNFAFTQEQRGANEVVVCYEVTTGNEV